jgi:hypothetical protein
VNGTLNLPTHATVGFVNFGYWTLFSATSLSGATDLSGWQIVGARNIRIVIRGQDVMLIPTGGLVFVVR